MYVLFEGIDGCGKSTQIERFPSAIKTKEPYNMKLREMLLNGSFQSKRAELLLFLADRAEHFQKIILPNQDKLIISDRGFLSGIGYALANGDFDFDELISLNQFALYETFPDKIVMFEIDKKTLIERLGKRESLDAIELRGLDYLLTVQKYMIESLKKLDIAYIIVDASDDLESISNKILRFIEKIR